MIVVGIHLYDFQTHELDESDECLRAPQPAVWDIAEPSEDYLSEFWTVFWLRSRSKRNKRFMCSKYLRTVKLMNDLQSKFYGWLADKLDGWSPKQNTSSRDDSTDMSLDSIPLAALESWLKENLPDDYHGEYECKTEKTAGLKEKRKSRVN